MEDKKLLCVGMNMRRRSWRRLVFWMVLGICFFWIVMATQWWQRRLVSQVVAPLLALQHSVTDQVRAWRIQRLGHDELVILLEKTLRERDVLLQHVVELESALNYRKDCFELDNFRRRYKLKSAVVAQVLLKNLSETTHFFLVNAGENRGIAEDMIAVCHNHLIGRVSEVNSSYSKVVLITDSASRVASVCSRTGARGILEGMNDIKRLKLAFVSHSDELKVDDLVVSYGAGLVFPRGFGLGKIASVTAAGIFQDVFVEPLIDLQSIDFCLLVSREVIEASSFELVQHGVTSSVKQDVKFDSVSKEESAPPSAAVPSGPDVTPSIKQDAKIESGLKEEPVFAPPPPPPSLVAAQESSSVVLTADVPLEKPQVV